MAMQGSRPLDKDVHVRLSESAHSNDVRRQALGCQLPKNHIIRRKEKQFTTPTSIHNKTKSENLQIETSSIRKTSRSPERNDQRDVHNRCQDSPSAG